MKHHITEGERLQLFGLLTLARQNAKQIDACEKAMGQILDISNTNLGHLSDAIWEDSDIDTILANMSIRLEQSL